jgi:hypothetical protein
MEVDGSNIDYPWTGLHKRHQIGRSAIKSFDFTRSRYQRVAQLTRLGLQIVPKLALSSSGREPPIRHQFPILTFTHFLSCVRHRSPNVIPAGFVSRVQVPTREFWIVPTSMKSAICCVPFLGRPRCGTGGADDAMSNVWSRRRFGGIWHVGHAQFHLVFAPEIKSNDIVVPDRPAV